jgi:hypothetical protein
MIEKMKKQMEKMNAVRKIRGDIKTAVRDWGASFNL